MLFSLHAKHVGRRNGNSAVAAAAYRSGEKLINECDGLAHDYAYRDDVVHTEIMLPDNAPEEFSDRSTLWNTAELAENRRDARVALEIVVALQREFSFETSLASVKAFVKNNFIQQGRCADIAIHLGLSKDSSNVDSNLGKNFPHNPHAHILLTTRSVCPSGLCDKKNPDWNKPYHLKQWRKDWADIQNRTFATKGLVARISDASYKARGIDREPTKHLGPIFSTMERRGIQTDIGNINREITERNKERERKAQERVQRRRLELSR